MRGISRFLWDESRSCISLIGFKGERIRTYVVGLILRFSLVFLSYTHAGYRVEDIISLR